ncbi:hypothetical protein P3X46_022195, partial [Hevea brasiliensis]
DESRNVSVKKQMIVILRYVDKNDCVIERFFGIVHIFYTSALSLKSSIESLFARHGLSMAILRGSGYDVTMGDIHIASLFNMIASLLNVVGASCKCRDILRESQATEVSEALKTGEMISYRRLNQETSLKRATDAHWDLQLQELNSHFTEMNTELLLCVACLNPNNSFSSFDKEKLIHLAQFYPCDFSSTELMALDNQLETYIIDVCSNDEFSTIKGIGGFAQKFVQTKKNLAYPLVYLLVKLALILHVATASVERAFSTMKTVKI